MRSSDLGAPTAAAAPPEPFTITEAVDLSEGGVDTFTTSGGALCDSGTFEDEVVAGGGHPDTSGKLNLLIRTVYTCDDGSGTFNAQKHVLVALGEDGSFTNSGPITLTGGTGRYTRLSGHGVDNGTSSGNDLAVGEISGVLRLT